jgi:hypothetical protein
MKMSDLPDVLNVGKQGWWHKSVGHGTDFRERVCWRCCVSETADPLETCKACLDELAG